MTVARGTGPREASLITVARGPVPRDVRWEEGLLGPLGP